VVGLIVAMLMVGTDGSPKAASTGEVSEMPLGDSARFQAPTSTAEGSSTTDLVEAIPSGSNDSTRPTGTGVALFLVSATLVVVTAWIAWRRRGDQ
jgi:hypothetical protein